MNKQEFMAGYAILTIQPWGKLYRGNGPEATIQAELYYKHVNQASGKVWQAVCEASATGEKWPSLSDLKTALQQQGGWRQEGQHVIEHTPEFVECPAEVAERLRKLGVNV